MTESDMTTENPMTPLESEHSQDTASEAIASEAIASEGPTPAVLDSDPASDGEGANSEVDAELEVPAAFDALEIEPDPEAIAPPPDAATQTPPHAALDALKQEIESLTAQLEERNSQYVRIVADFENFRNRTQREKQEQDARVKASTLRDLLPVVDNFERARAQLTPQGEEAIQIHKSYQGIYKQLVDGLKRLGVSPMRAEGKEFDPTLHEAVLREPTDQYEEGIVMDELQRGYLLDEMVLRHAMVKVAAAPEGDSDASPAVES